MDQATAQKIYDSLVISIAMETTASDATDAAMAWCNLGSNQDKLNALRSAVTELKLTRKTPTTLKAGVTLDQEEHWALATLIKGDVAEAIAKKAAAA